MKEQTKKLYDSPTVNFVQTEMTDVLSTSLDGGYSDAKGSDIFAPTLWQ